jgi:hypothetical protein
MEENTLEDFRRKQFKALVLKSNRYLARAVERYKIPLHKIHVLRGMMNAGYTNLTNEVTGAVIDGDLDLTPYLDIKAIVVDLIVQQGVMDAAAAAALVTRTEEAAALHFAAVRRANRNTRNPASDWHSKFRCGAYVPVKERARRRELWNAPDLAPCRVLVKDGQRVGVA